MRIWRREWSRARLHPCPAPGPFSRSGHRVMAKVVGGPAERFKVLSGSRKAPPRCSGGHVDGASGNEFVASQA